MFFGKTVCVVSVLIIGGTCGMACLDKKVSIGNKAKLIALSGALAGIVASL
jgi:hypothetical protein